MHILQGIHEYFKSPTPKMKKYASIYLNCFPVIFKWIVTGATSGAENALFLEYLISLPFEELMISLRMCQWLCLQINDPDLFVWIRLTALS